MSNAERCRRYYQKRCAEIAELRQHVNMLIQENQRLIDRVNMLEGRVNMLSDPLSPPTTPPISPEDTPSVRLSPDISPREDRGENAPLGGKNGTRKGTRLGLDWQPCEADRRFAALAGLDADRIAEEFRDYWVAKPGANACKLDWCATWRNWCRKAAERSPARKIDSFERTKAATIRVLERLAARDRGDSGGFDSDLWLA